ncbi:hypothetical protein BC828DRAFT_259798 [Blastocladiella britannica]|nr:hypothetical protein BC828DRAFT_259798 [Blastocladiella britannica]
MLTDRIRCHLVMNNMTDQAVLNRCLPVTPMPMPKEPATCNGSAVAGHWEKMMGLNVGCSLQVKVNTLLLFKIVPLLVHRSSRLLDRTTIHRSKHAGIVAVTGDSGWFATFCKHTPVSVKWFELVCIPLGYMVIWMDEKRTSKHCWCYNILETMPANPLGTRVCHACFFVVDRDANGARNQRRPSSPTSRPHSR